MNTETPGKLALIETINSTYAFHLSITAGLDETTEPILWSKAAGTARGLNLALRVFVSKEDPSDGAQAVRKRASRMYDLHAAGNTLIDSPDEEMQTYLSRGMLHGFVECLRTVEKSHPPDN